MNPILKEYRRDRTFFIATSLVAALVVVLIIIIVAMNAVKGAAHARTPTTTVPQDATTTANGGTPAHKYIAKIKNLTSESLYYQNNMTLFENVTISKINSVNVSAYPGAVQPGSTLYVNVTYTGEFGFDLYNSSPYLNATREVHYFGFYQQGTDKMLVYENKANVSSYFQLLYNKTVIGTPRGYNDTKYLSIDFQVVPMQNASGKSWYFCGGAFMSYANNTNWGNEFNNLTFNMKDASNATVFNIISSRCTLVKVN